MTNASGGRSTLKVFVKYDLEGCKTHLACMVAINRRLFWLEEGQEFQAYAKKHLELKFNIHSRYTMTKNVLKLYGIQKDLYKSITSLI